jgi:hypothetical protein
VEVEAAAAEVTAVLVAAAVVVKKHGAHSFCLVAWHLA